jgi:hypothetical protein
MARGSAVFLGLRHGALLPLALLSLLLIQGLRTGWADAAGITPKKVHLGRCDHPAFLAH